MLGKGIAIVAFAISKYFNLQIPTAIVDFAATEVHPLAERIRIYPHVPFFWISIASVAIFP